MKIKELIAREGKSISFEFFPPKTGKEQDRLLELVQELASLNPTFVSVTYGAGGSTREKTRHVIRRIKEETSLIPMSHLTCVDQSREEIESILNDYADLGIENILALRGDPPKGTTEPIFKDGLRHARDLVELAISFNAFSIAVAIYPEGHAESPSLEMDMFYTKQKIDAGADFAITQMFFENHLFYDFMERTEKVGIRVPIIPGIMPVTNIEKIKRFSQMCGASLPASLVHRIERASSQQEAQKIGIDFTTRQCQDLWRNGVRYFHFYTLNCSQPVMEILGDLALPESPSPRLATIASPL